MQFTRAGDKVAAFGVLRLGGQPITRRHPGLEECGVVPVAHRPADPWLSAGAAASEGEFAARMGLPSVPAIAEKIMLERDLALPAYDQCIKASHLFNLLDARGVISVAERASYIGRVRNLAKGCCEAWLAGETQLA